MVMRFIGPPTVLRFIDHHFDQRVVAVGGYPGVDDGEDPRHHVVGGDQDEAEIDRSNHLRAKQAAGKPRQD
jgi:hypothetical protein